MDIALWEYNKTFYIEVILMSVFCYDYIVKYFDIGKNNKLTLKSLVAIMQEAAGSHSDVAGFGLNDIPKTNFTWLLLNWKVKMFSHPKVNENLTIKTWPRALEKFYCYRDFEVYDSKQNKIAIASSKWVAVNLSTKKIMKVSPQIIDAYGGNFKKSVFDNPFEQKLTVPKNSNLNFEYKIQRRDIDTNGHVNNSYYIDFALEALDEECYNKNEFDNLEIAYKKEIKYKEKINCYYSMENNEHIITIKNNDNSIIHAIVKIY